jgi:hypothetical protein
MIPFPSSFLDEPLFAQLTAIRRARTVPTKKSAYPCTLCRFRRSNHWRNRDGPGAIDRAIHRRSQRSSRVLIFLWATHSPRGRLLRLPRSGAVRVYNLKSWRFAINSAFCTAPSNGLSSTPPTGFCGLGSASSGTTGGQHALLQRFDCHRRASKGFSPVLNLENSLWQAGATCTTNSRIPQNSPECSPRYRS